VELRMEKKQTIEWKWMDGERKIKEGLEINDDRV